MAAALVHFLKPSEQENPLLKDTGVESHRVEFEMLCLDVFSVLHVAGEVLRSEVRDSVFGEFHSWVISSFAEGSDKDDFVTMMAERLAGYIRALEISGQNGLGAQERKRRHSRETDLAPTGLQGQPPWEVGKAFARFCDTENDINLITTGYVRFTRHCVFTERALETILREYEVAIPHG
jgi:hypothetical protein